MLQEGSDHCKKICPRRTISAGFGSFLTAANTVALLTGRIQEQADSIDCIAQGCFAAY